MSSPFAPTPIEGAEPCERCEGQGTVIIDGEEVDCPECDGLGETFE